MKTNAVANLKKNTIAGVVGNILEWYDFAVFGFLAPFMSTLFFPASDPLAGLIKTYGIFAAGYMMRPLGGILFGHIGDRLGRVKALQLSIFLMAIPTVLVGFLPTHEQLGATAALLLIILRLAQGLSVGGELIGSISYLVEIAPADKRGLYGSWSLFSAVGGILLGSAVVTIITSLTDTETMMDWGWRVPFFFGAIIFIIGFWLRKGLEESPVFTQEKNKGELEGFPLLEVLKEMPIKVLRLSGIILLFGAGFYMLFVWMPTYLGKILSPPVEHALLLNTLSLIVLIAVIPLAGLLSDHFGRKPVMLTGILLMGILAYPLFILVDHGLLWTVLAAQLVFAVLMGLVQGPLPAMMVEMFPTRTRLSAVGLGYNLTLAVFGGTAPMVCTWLIQKTGDLASPAIYLMILSAISFICLFTFKSVDNFERNN